jgi:hypothetical protein
LLVEAVTYPISVPAIRVGDLDLICSLGKSASKCECIYWSIYLGHKVHVTDDHVGAVGNDVEPL